MKLSFLLSIILFIGGTTTGCSTPRKSQVASIMGGMAVGAVVGSATAPKGESAVLHATLWGGALGSIAGIASLYIFDSDKELRASKVKRANLELQNEELRRQIRTGKRQVNTHSDVFESPLPNKLKGLVIPGKWTLFELDQWVNDGDSRMIHQDKMFEIIPPRMQVETN